MAYRTHGLSLVNGRPRSEYTIWLGMKMRCGNPKDNRYHQYGGRGIKVCDEWLYDFPAFYAYIGPRPSPRHTVDRIDNDKGYEPGNVRWATYREQNVKRAPFARKNERPVLRSDGVRFRNLRQAALAVGVTAPCIRNCCDGVRGIRQSGGYGWTWA